MPTAVAAGLKAIKTTATEIGTTVRVDADQAKTLDARHRTGLAADRGHDQGERPDTYITFEDNFAAISKAVEDKDAAQGRRRRPPRSRRPPTPTWRSIPGEHPRATRRARRVRTSC